MDTTILDHISFEPDSETLAANLHVRPDSPFFESIVTFCQEAREIARPKCVYRVAFIEERGDDFVVIDGIRFKSRILSVNLAGVNRVFPSISTCGKEIEDWSKNKPDMLDRYWTDQIVEMAMRSAAEQATSAIKAAYQLNGTAFMSPGSLEDWPLSEQPGLFATLGSAPAAIGVELTASMLMNPTKSVSRLMFESETGYQNCQLCPREDCPNRRAPYTPDLLHQKYGVSKQ